MTSNIGIYVFTGSVNKKRCDCIKETWGKDLRIDFFTDLDSGQLEKGFHLGSLKGGYRSHLEKNAKAMMYAYRIDQGCTAKDWHLFVGDDNYVFTDNLEKFVKDKDPNELHVFGQVEANYPKIPELMYPTGGAGHLFSRGALDFFMKNGPLDIVDFFMSEEYSDVAVGKILDSINLEPTDAKGFFSQPPEHYGIDDPENHIVFHYISTKKQFENLYDRQK